MNVLAIGAHPDDIEIQCAGTLALVREGRAQGLHGGRDQRQCRLADPHPGGDRRHPSQGAGGVLLTDRRHV